MSSWREEVVVWGVESGEGEAAAAAAAAAAAGEVRGELKAAVVDVVEVTVVAVVAVVEGMRKGWQSKVIRFGFGFLVFGFGSWI